jgi:calcineurin-like phosphoesterase
LAINRILTEQAQKGDIIIVDFHSEATSEKVAFGYYLDGRVSAVLGTHTHVATADARVLPKGTAYISDAGMTGARDGVIGVKFENVIKKFLDPGVKFKNEPEEEGVLQINGVLIETNDKGQAAKIEKLYQEI